MKLFLGICLFLYVVQVQSLYFHIKETERKCFIEEVPDETLVVGKYKVHLLWVTARVFDRRLQGDAFEVADVADGSGVPVRLLPFQSFAEGAVSDPRQPLTRPRVRCRPVSASVQQSRTPVALLVLLARAARARIVASDLLRVADWLTPYGGRNAPGHIAPALLQEVRMDLPDRVAETGGPLPMFVLGENLPLQLLPALLRPVQDDCGQPVGMADRDRQPSRGVQTDALHVARPMPCSIKFIAHTRAVPAPAPSRGRRPP